MKLKRKIESELSRWIETDLVLLLTGSRQVGKTYILNDFMQARFSSCLQLSLHNNVPLIKAILGARDQKDFLLRLTAFGSTPLGEGGCVFIDEVQEFYTYLNKHPEVEEYYDLITAMKDITRNTGIRFILSGSLLRLRLEKFVNLNPEGSILRLSLFPLDFEEFLWARGLSQELIDEAKAKVDAREEVPDYLHDRLMREFQLYLLVGGMPAAVKEFLEKNSFVYVDMAHKAIDDYVRQDITKYAPDEARIKIESIYELLPRELSSPAKRFVLSQIQGHKKNEQEYLNFGWLAEAGVAILANAVSEPIAPLKASSSLNKVKVFHEDVGLLTYLLMDSELKQKVILGESDGNFGAIYENAVAELLRAHGFSSLYFYFQKTRGEVDFLLERKGKVELIEIKSGKDYNRFSALRNLLSVPNYSFGGVSVYYNGNVQRKDEIDYLPIYAIEFLRK